MSGSFLVLDLGGTNMRVGVSRGGERLDEVKSVPTPPKFAEGIESFQTIAHELLAGAQVQGIVGGIGWALDKSRSHIFRSTKENFVDWNDKPLREELEKKFSVPVRLENDCVLAALGEAHEGAGGGSKIMAYVTVSTGVNGARIVDGAIDKATYGFEIGKQHIESGQLEALVSGVAVQKKYGIHPKDLADIDARNALADLLAEGLFNTVLHWSPDTIVLGGSMITGVNPIPLPRVAEILSKMLTIYPSAPSIKMAELGDSNVLCGARILANTLG